MANPLVLTGFANPDPNAAPTNITELVKLLNQLVMSQIQGSYMPYVVGHDIPAVEDQDKVWIQLEPSGIPLGIFTFYNGNWRRVYNGMRGEIKMYGGIPSQDFDSTGLGNIGPSAWYDGWALCNGQNGTPDLSDKFISCAHLSDLTNGYDDTNGFKSNIEGTVDGTAVFAHTGGVPSVTLDDAHTFRNPVKAIGAYLWTASNNAPADNGDMYGLHNNQTIFKPLYNSDGSVQTDDAGNTSPTPIDIVNPYIALGFIMFVGYH